MPRKKSEKTKNRKFSPTDKRFRKNKTVIEEPNTDSTVVQNPEELQPDKEQDENIEIAVTDDSNMSDADDLKDIGFKKGELNDKKPDEEINPIEANVEQRDYTSGGADNKSQNTGESFDEPEVAQQQSEIPKVDLPKVKQEKPAKAYTIDDFNKDSEIEPGDSEISDKQKRKNAKKTVEVALNTFSQVMPLPFIMLGKYPEKKLHKLELAGKINKKMVVTAEGHTLRQYVDIHNSQVEGAFAVTEEDKDVLREPATDFLMENDLELSPGWRLAIAVGTVMLPKTIALVACIQDRNMALERFVEIHKENLRAGYYQNRPQPQAQQAQPEAPQPETKAEKLGMDEYITDVELED